MLSIPGASETFPSGFHHTASNSDEEERRKQIALTAPWVGVKLKPHPQQSENSVTSKQKKEFERKMLCGLLMELAKIEERESRDFPGVLGKTVKIDDEDHESPDLLLLIDGKKIGVEVTEIQKSGEERAERAKKTELIKRAKHAYESGTNASIGVNFSYLRNARLGTANRKSLSNEIAELLRDHIEAENDTVIVTRDRLPPGLRKYFSDIRFWRQPNGIWQCPEASDVPTLTADIIQDAVDAKGELLPDYRAKGYDAYWLLVCAEMGNPATIFEAPSDFDPTPVSSPFDRTFFYNGWHTFELGPIRVGKRVRRE